MKKFKNFIALAAAAAILLTGCANNEITSGVSDSTSSSTNSSSSSSSTGSNGSDGSSTSTLSSGSEDPESSQTPESSDTSSSESSGSQSSSTSSANESSTSENNNSSAENSTPEQSSSNSDQSSSSVGTVDPPAGGDSTPYSIHGAISVKGTDLVDKNGQKFQLRGMSTHGLAWFPQFVNRDTFKYLRDDWNTNCVRLAMYTDEYGGYCSGGDKNALKSLVKNGVDYATELGMYVIVDWHILHDQNPLRNKDEARLFFDEISKQYAGYDNIVYEICNEPNSSASWSDISTYANEIIPVIRANDSNAVIIVGTPTWSQDIDQALNSPLKFDNVMYVLHFYAATHTDWLRQRMENCIKNGLPVFVSEFGITDASGNGAVNINEANAWKDLIERYNVSYMCWNLANKDETSSILHASCNKLTDWSDSDLSEQGKWIRDWFKSETD